MYKIGDKIVYPMHGAGTIEAIEEKEVLGVKKQYYILSLLFGSMKVLIPTTNCKEIGLREVISSEEVKEVICVLQKDEPNGVTANWNRRYRANLEKMRSGNIYEIAEVVRNLARREQEKGLSAGERKMLENARQILISEFALAKEIEKDKAQLLIDNAFA